MPEAFCGFETVRKWVLLNLWVLWEKEISFVREGTPQRFSKMFFFSQKNTEEQNTQSFTETLSQPISQSVTANLSWKASVNSVCRRRSVNSKCAQKCSVNSVRSVRDKTPQRFACISSHQAGAFYFSQKNTEEQNTQRPTKIAAPPPTPPPEGRGVITEIPL